MQTPRFLALRAWPWLGCVLLAACGGGAEEDQAVAASADDTPMAATAAVAPAGTVRLASANVAGSPAAGGGQVCATSADGQQVLFTSIASNLLPGDSNLQEDLFLKNLDTGAVLQVNTNAAGGSLINRTALLCHAMSSDGTWVAFTTSTGGSNPYLPPVEIEPTLMLKNTRTGELLRVSPPRISLPATSGYTFASMTPDGARVAFIAQPTTTDLGGYQTEAIGPARLLVYDRPQRRVLDLSATVLLDAGPGIATAAENRVVLSPDGRTVAYDALRDQPAAGDANGQPDLLQAQVDGPAVQRVNLPGTVDARPRPLRYTADGQGLVFEAERDSSLGVAGAYALTLSTGGRRLLAPKGGGLDSAQRYVVDATASRVAYVRDDPATQQRSYAFVRDTVLGTEQRVDTAANGTRGNGVVYALTLSDNGLQAVYTSSSTNLLRLPRGTSGAQVYAKTLTNPVAQR